MAVTGSEKVTAGGPVAKTLEPNIATQNTDLSRTNLLNELDSDAQVAAQDAMPLPVSLYRVMGSAGIEEQCRDLESQRIA